MDRFALDLNLLSDECTKLFSTVMIDEVLEQLDETKSGLLKDSRSVTYEFYPKSENSCPFILAFSYKEFGPNASFGIGYTKQRSSVFTYESLGEPGFFEYAKHCIHVFLRSKVTMNCLYLHTRNIGGDYTIGDGEVEVVGFGRRHVFFWKKKALTEKQIVYEPWVV